MKNITVTITTNDEKLGSFPLDPLIQIRLLADAKANGLSLPDYTREAIRQGTVRDDYQGEIFCTNEADVQAVSNELLATV